jgi:copper(I)-binding protein
MAAFATPIARLMKITRLLAGLAFAGATALAQAHDYTAGALHIAHPWARATTQGQRVGGAYLEIANSGAADKLLSVRGDVAESVQLHTMALQDNVMHMREVDGIELPAGGKVALGYSEREAAAALKALPADIGVSEGIKQALKALAR